MNREEIMKLEAGRELDALIAERIFGWKRDTEPVHPEIRLAGGLWNTPNGRCSFLPRYSTHIADAWQVVERMSRIPETIEEAHAATNTQFMFRFEDEHIWACTAKEAALAICRAALLAMPAGAS